MEMEMEIWINLGAVFAVLVAIVGGGWRIERGNSELRTEFREEQRALNSELRADIRINAENIERYRAANEEALGKLRDIIAKNAEGMAELRGMLTEHWARQK